jgi:hypothetical protein
VPVNPARRNINTGTVWHYTVGDNFHKIIKTGVIVQSGLGQLKRLKPVVWFSKNQFWEPTASKKHPQNPELDLATWQENAKFYNGVYRIGADLSKTPMLPWSIAPQIILFTAKGTRNLEDSGRAVGANPNDWFACLNAVRRDEWTAIQVLEDGAWKDFAPDDSVRWENNMDINLAATELVQKVINGPATVASIRTILSGAAPNVRDEAINLFRTSSKLRELFPEFAELFDKEDFTLVN